MYLGNKKNDEYSFDLKYGVILEEKTEMKDVGPSSKIVSEAGEDDGFEKIVH